MFPLDFPQRVIAEYHEPNTAILDPFCGRGTSLFAARKSGIYSIGIDSSPVAAAIARSKVLCTTPEKILLVAKRILSSNKNPQVPVGEFWEYAYHPETLYSICKLRESLLVHYMGHYPNMEPLTCRINAHAHILQSQTTLLSFGRIGG